MLLRLQFESVPLPILYAAKSSSEKFSLIDKIIKRKKISSENATELLKYCFETGAIDYTKSLAEKSAKEALKKLTILRQSSSRDALELMVGIAISDVSSLPL